MTTQMKHNWEPPTTTLVKINVDAAISNGNNGGVEAVIRNGMGHILTAAIWPTTQPLETLEAEALAIYLGMKLAKECCFMEIVIESDCIEVVNELKHGRPNPTCFRAFVVDALSLMCNFRLMAFTHIKKSGNKVAHELAKE
ncbi:uncharacterized protein [Arachis hypogaea]|uniref:uncharacterized protein n=1 Tax=Arachis hypogaea TaxID=3818 RepID=UPI000DED0A5B